MISINQIESKNGLVISCVACEYLIKSIIPLREFTPPTGEKLTKD